MATEIDAARLLIWRAGWMLAEGIPFARGEGSMAKLFAGDMAMRVTTEAVQVLGGYGYIKEYPVERFMRDAKIYQIWEGTAEIQRLVISRCLLGERQPLARPTRRRARAGDPAARPSVSRRPTAAAAPRLRRRRRPPPPGPGRLRPDSPPWRRDLGRAAGPRSACSVAR